MSSLDVPAKNVTTRTRAVALWRDRTPIPWEPTVTRIITIEDDDEGHSARLVVKDSAICQITISTEDPHGLPDDVISSLIPYIGLPAARPARNGTAPSRPQHPRRTPQHRAPRIPAQPDPVAISAAPDGQRREEPEPVPLPAKTEAPARAKRQYRRAPSDDELEQAIRELDTASPSRLAAHFHVPSHTASNWLAKWRKRKVQEGSAP